MSVIVPEIHEAGPPRMPDCPISKWLRIKSKIRIAPIQMIIVSSLNFANPGFLSEWKMDSDSRILCLSKFTIEVVEPEGSCGGDE